MKTRLDMNKIAKGLGAERRGSVAAKSGYFGALQLLGDVAARFRVPARGGRATDPAWTQRRLVPLAPQTLARLEALSTRMRKQGNGNIEPMQLAGLLLERATEELAESETSSFAQPRRTES